MDPTIVNEFPLSSKVILYVGIPMVTGLCIALRTLWKANEAKDLYIRESDKANIVLLTNLSKALEIMHADINNLPEDVKEKLTPILSEIKHSIDLKNNAHK